MNVSVIDYGMGNLKSVYQAFRKLGYNVQIIEDGESLLESSHAILPGVGAFGDCMEGLQRRELVEPIREFAKSGKPLLGICLGMQAFFESSTESPEVEGLGLIPGQVVRFSGDAYSNFALKVPHMGWNKLNLQREHPLFQDLPEEAYYYFVHSYFVAPSHEDHVIARCSYGQDFCAVAGFDNIVGCQFHPEKSQALGLKILDAFMQQ